MRKRQKEEYLEGDHMTCSQVKLISVMDSTMTPGRTFKFTATTQEAASHLIVVLFTRTHGRQAKQW